ncbi:unnamed protein product [Dibothriocephalus latus]|uniref:Iron-sulfur cluster assembly 2 homolog, mitochondrial n=1 Tax=Dibothriocephalus latus TaxID=60516 RepID=A0A3P6UC28_DIBLA|nr:unnamed protein product [Dibothriocephalus latus]
MSLVVRVINFIGARASNYRQFKTLLDEVGNNYHGLILHSKRLREIGEDDGLLRVMVDSGGCSGFQYKFLIEKNINEDDHVITQSGARVVIDDQSFSLLDGSTLEYEEELIRSGFRVTKNPQAEKGCSCGSSFAVRLD